MGTQIFQKPRSHLKILGARRKTWSKYWVLRRKFSRRGDLAPVIFEPLTMGKNIMMVSPLNSVQMRAWAETKEDPLRDMVLYGQVYAHHRGYNIW